MSYDVSIGRESFNYTYNLGELFREAIPGGIIALDGHNGRGAFDVIASGLREIDRQRMRMGDAEFCKRYDAPNGWGSTLGATLFLVAIMVECQRRPRSIVRVS